MNHGWLHTAATGLVLALLAAGPAADDKGKATLDRDEARKLGERLNEVRKDPAKYGKEIGVDLGGVKPRGELKWDATLTKVAEAKALDMANRDYFDHVTPEGRGINVLIHEAGYELPADWVKDKKQNFFESICAGTGTAAATLRVLITDKGLEGAPHRKHLLGTTDFYAECTDIGAAIARRPGSTHRFYVSIIIARKK
jgi:uncharacterized protein YkwD